MPGRIFTASSAMEGGKIRVGSSGAGLAYLDKSMLWFGDSTQVMDLMVDLAAVRSVLLDREAAAAEAAA